jgi:hypothetical protein
MRQLSPKVEAAISAVVESAAKAGTLVQVYAESERIRQSNINENLALEDIAEELIRRSAQGPGYEADLSDARRAPYWVTIRKRQQFIESQWQLRMTQEQD